MKTISFEQLIKTTTKALLLGGDILKRGASEIKRVSYKSAIDPVTHVDLAIEKKVIRAIRSIFPQHGFVAEESSYKKGGTPVYKGYQWIIDPLDGTVNFVHGIPQSCVSIAVALDGAVLAGGIYDPYRKELFLAASGRGASLNGKKISVSKEKSMRRSILITGFPYKRQTMMTELMETLGKMLLRCADVRRFGSAAIDLSWIACGRAEGYWESSLNPWDVAAGALLVSEAGGLVTDFSGRPFHLSRSSQLVASNKNIHPSLIAILKKRFS